jgi:dTDP-4-dehydrorhamnose reductase
MKILVTGSNGQLGNELRVLAPQFPFAEFTFTDIGELDITHEPSVDELFGQLQPEAVINCAAYTAVDKAEQETGTATLINATAAGILAGASARINATLIHVSTDYVFNGMGYRPYVETDIPDPVSAYAKTKFAGETEVHRFAKKALIIRTSWLYSSFGHNFVKTIMKYGKEREQMNVVFDQVGTPTYARDLAKAILDILSGPVPVNGVETYHYANEGVASWYDFALAIVKLTGLRCRINPIVTEEYPLPATRPFYSVFNKHSIKNRFGLTIPYWRDSLEECIKRIVEQQ